MHTRLWIVVASAAALAACGGGSTEDTSGTSISTEVAQGYAADAGTMPVAAATGVEAAVGALESAVSATTGADRAQPQAVQPQATLSAQCVRGGSVTWQASGGTALGNGQLDTGEIYTVSYDGCVTGDGGPTIDGSLSLTVNARSTGRLAYTMTATKLTFTQGTLEYVLDGNVSEDRRSLTDVTGTQVTGDLTSTGLSLESTIGSRQATYRLNTLAWTVVRTFDANGRLVTRSHQGTLELSANTPRRPDASLAISTVGSTIVGSDGFISAGTYTVRTSRDTVRCEHGGGTVTLSLDRGNDGTIDRVWTLTRTVFLDGAG